VIALVKPLRLSDRPRAQLRRATVEGLAVLIGATVFVCFLFWPVASHLGSMVIGWPGGDSSGAIGWLWQLQHEDGFHLFGTTHHTLTGAPFGWTEGNGRNPQWLLPYYPAYLATKLVGEIAAFNLVILTGYVLSGVAMFALVRYLGCNRMVSVWAALIYIVFPRHLVHAQHASLVHIEVFAILMIALVAFARRPSWPRFALVGGAILACCLTAGYFGVMAMIGGVAFALGAALTLNLRQATWILVGSVAAAAAAGAVFASLSTLGGVSQDPALQRDVGNLSIFGIRPIELVVPADGNLIVGKELESFHASHLHGSTLTETTNYLGLLTLALALGWLVIAWRYRARLKPQVRLATAGFAAVCVAALAFGAPSPFVIFGHEIWMPSRLVWEVVPALRVPSRWVILVMTALIPLSALGLQAAWARVERRARSSRRFRGAPLALVGLAMLISFAELTISPARPRYRADKLPGQYTALDRTPDGILAEYPLIAAYDYSFWQRRHGRALLNGAATGTEADAVRRVLLNPGAPGTANALALLGVTAIITDAGALDFTDGAPDVPDAHWGRGYRLVARLPDRSSVWRVVAPPAPAVLALHGGFAEPIIVSGDEVGYPMPRARAGELEFVAKARDVIRLSFDALAARGVQTRLHLGDGRHRRTLSVDGRSHVSVLVEIPRGRSHLLIETRPAARRVVLVAPRAERATGKPVLRALPVSREPGF
jgi:hypothetical protein